jgi:hypothetical protein
VDVLVEVVVDVLVEVEVLVIGRAPGRVSV